ncbi:MAG: hypothetical protein JSS96_07630 [Bacteroidetes bacterium]|nr:hypothetical protein [Bacteroidota bacterium]
MRLSFAIIIVCLSTCSIVANAQQNTVRKSVSSQSVYNTATVTTVKGRVEKIEKVNNGRKNYGIHLMLKTASETIAVHLGPQWYMEDKMDNIKEGSKIEVKGSKVTIDGKPAIIAQTIMSGANTLQLRDVNGKPLWSGTGLRRK